MGNHIEQLMKTAGVEKMPVKGYPLFTPSKQLELIKLIGTGNGINWSFTLSKYHLFKKWTFTATINTGVTEIEHANFDQGLAELVLVLINENKLDKSEVKKILED